MYVCMYIYIYIYIYICKYHTHTLTHARTGGAAAELSGGDVADICDAAGAQEGAAHAERGAAHRMQAHLLLPLSGARASHVVSLTCQWLFQDMRGAYSHLKQALTLRP